MTNRENFLLTDQNHNSLALLMEASINHFFKDENESYAILILREKNLNMTELLSSQVECNIWDDEYEL